jgi:signal peptidase I
MAPHPYLQKALRELRMPALMVAFMLVAQTAISQPFSIPTGSMEPTLLVGDAIAASKPPYGYGRFSAPFGLMPNFSGRLLGRPAERGDIAVLALPRDPSQAYVKRVIGLPGDRVQMKAGQLYINGELVPREAAGRTATRAGLRTVWITRYIETLPNGRSHEIIKSSDRTPLDDTREFLVPDGSYFMLGDNRNRSLDSRVPPEEGGVGFVPSDNLIGRVDRVLFSINPLAGWREAIDNPGALRISRVLQHLQ